MKTASAIRIIVVMMVVFVTTAAYSQNGSGNISTQEFKTDNFSQVDLGDDVDYYLIQGQECMVKVESDDNLLGKFKFEVRNNTLTVNTRMMTGATRLKIFITAREFTSVKASGSSSITGQGTIKGNTMTIEAGGASEVKAELEVTDLSTNVSGAATLSLTGSSATHTSVVSGAADLKAADLRTKKTNIQLTGASNARVDATDELSGSVSGASDLQYKSKPANLEIKKSGAASTEVIDTATLKLGEREIFIVENDNQDCDKGPGSFMDKGPGKFMKKFNKKDRVKLHWAGINVGINGYMNRDYGFSMPAGYDFMYPDYAKSWFVDLNFFQIGVPIIKKHWHLVTGMGFQFNNYRIDKHYMVQPGTDYFEAVKDSSTDFLRNKLSAVYFQIPLLFQFDTKKIKGNSTFHVVLGVIGGVRVSSHTKQVFNVNGAKSKLYTWDDFNLAPLRWSAMLKIGYGPVNLFASYQLNQMFRPKHGPQLYPFAIGLSFSGF